MKRVSEQVHFVVIDALQFEQVLNVDTSTLVTIHENERCRFVGSIAVELDGGIVRVFDGEHSRSDFVGEYGFALMSFNEMDDHGRREFVEQYDELKSEVDAKTLYEIRRLM